MIFTFSTATGVLRGLEDLTKHPFQVGKLPTKLFQLTGIFVLFLPLLEPEV
jgi:hypothetical protein